MNKLEEYLKIWWAARNDNYLLFYGLITIAKLDLTVILENNDVKPVTKKTETERKDKKKEIEDKTLIDNQKVLEEFIKEAREEAERIKKEEIERKAKEITKTPSEQKPKRQTFTPYIDSNEVEIKIIHSFPEPGKSEPKRIGYIPNDNFKQENPYNYAVVKMPNKNSLIKFPRKGRSDKKGYKEDDFFIYLNQYFNKDFNVLNDRHIPTENGRPYEPDLILSNEKENKNIFINIEIDEPYDGLMRTPTHCLEENDLRDEFFTKRGWIVIRFAEIQIHQEPTKCCTYIAKVIASIDATFKSDLLNEKNPYIVKQWTNLQAKKWAIEKYREKYLGILNFGKRPNVVTEYEIEDSESDIAVEEEVPKNHINSINTNDKLAKENTNERDKRITFDPIEHRYFIDGNPDTISVTQLIDKFFPEFDSLYWAPIKANQRGILTQEILAEWEEKRVDSANKGTALHEAIENYYNGSNYNSKTPEFQQFLEFKNKYNSMTPYRSEWRVFDEDLLIAGVYQSP